MARPKADIDGRNVYKLACIGCNASEIAQFYDVAPSTITRRFAKELSKGNFEIKRKLRRKQLEVAMKGNPSMLIWLGKQELGQSDKTEIQGNDQKPLTVFHHSAVVAAITGRPERNSAKPGNGESGGDGTPVG